MIVLIWQLSSKQTCYSDSPESPCLLHGLNIDLFSFSLMLPHGASIVQNEHFAEVIL